MRVFVTGGSGFVGSAVVRQLIAAGHHVTGLARSESSAAVLDAAGADVVKGDLADLESLAAGAIAADGVIHCGFIHDFNNLAHSVEVDRRAIGAFGDALAGSGRPLLVTAGTAGLSPGRLSTEDDGPDPHVQDGTPRVSEQAGLALEARGVRVGVVRLPPSVHGAGDHGFIPMLIGIARQRGASAYIETGDNRWPAVHRDDAASLFRLALERGAAGQRHHAIGDEGIPFRAIASVIGRRLGVPVVSIPSSAAAGHFGWMGRFASMDVPASAALTRARLGWEPSGPGLIEEMERAVYFAD